MPATKKSATDLSPNGRQNEGLLILPPSEAIEFERARATIRDGMATYVAVGLALQQVNEKGWYKAAGFRTFAEFARAEWDISRAQAYRLMEAAKTAMRIEAEGGTPPTTERQARVIASASRSPRRRSEAMSSQQEDPSAEIITQPSSDDFCLSDLGIKPSPPPEFVGCVTSAGSPELPAGFGLMADGKPFGATDARTDEALALLARIESGESVELPRSEFDALAAENKALKAQVTELTAALYAASSAPVREIERIPAYSDGDTLLVGGEAHKGKQKATRTTAAGGKGAAAAAGSRGDGDRQAETGRPEAALPVTAPVAPASKASTGFSKERLAQIQRMRSEKARGGATAVVGSRETAVLA